MLIRLVPSYRIHIGFMITILIALTVGFAYADEIVNFTINSSRPDNPLIFPVKENEPVSKVSESNNKIIPTNIKEGQSLTVNKETTLSPLRRAKDVLVDFLWNPRNCESDSECTFTQFCHPSANKCVKRAGECQPVKINGDVILKKDLVFVGDGFNNSEELRKVVLNVAGYNKSYGGVMSVEPFKSNENLFNVWMVTAEGTIPKNILDYVLFSQHAPDRSTSLEVAKRCEFADYVVVLSKTHYRSFAHFDGGDAYVSISYNDPEYTGFVVVHELGHSIGWLADEYVEEVKGDQWRWPNCAPDNKTADEWWGGTPETGNYSGCSYVLKNTRPTETSIMAMTSWDFGEVNKQHLQSILRNGVFT